MLIRFKLRQDSEGFSIIVNVKQGTQDRDYEGHLPAIPTALKTAMDEWRSAYLGLEEIRLRLTPHPCQTNSSKGSLYEYANKFEIEFNNWLNAGDREWQQTQQRLAALSVKTGEKNILLDVKDDLLRRFPWHEWQFFRDYFQNAEIGMQTIAESGSLWSASGVVQILVVVGHSQGIELGVEEDIQTIQSFADSLGARVHVLRQPTAQTLLNQLRNNCYEMFVFTGHSRSERGGHIGWLQLSETVELDLGSLQNTLSSAIQKRLQICIFNSCDGLGLANQLARLNLPVSIVMREPVPDSVATCFLKVFLKEFAGGRSLFQACREARQQLEQFTQYRGICWLPIICVDHAVNPPTWVTLQGNLPDADPPLQPVTTHTINRFRWIYGIMAALIVGAGLVTYFIKSSRPSLPLSCQSFFPNLQPLIYLSSLPIKKGWIYGGSNSWTTLQSTIAPWITVNYPEFQLQHIQLLGSHEGIEHLKQEKLDFALSSEPLTRTDEVAGLEAIPVALDGIAIVVNPNLSQIDNLSLEQLKAIYTGTVTNWRQLGGEDQPIVPFSRPDASGTTRFFQKEVLEGEAFGDQVQLVPTTTEDLRKVANTPGSIYFGTASLLVGQCTVKPIPILNQGTPIPPYEGNLIPRDRNCPKLPRNHPNATAFRQDEYPLVRSLYVVVRRNSGDAERAGRAYAALLRSPGAQNMIKRADFVPLSPLR